MPRRPATKINTNRLSREEWVTAALKAISDGGLGAANIQRLAAALGVTTGSFYWHFSSREEMIDAALERWEHERIDAVEQLREIADPKKRLETLVHAMYTHEERGALFAALQSSASNVRIRNLLRRAMQRRLVFLTQTYRELGYPIERARNAARAAHSLYSGLWELSRTLPAADENSVSGERLAEYIQYILQLMLPDEKSTLS